jgi:L-alanine-DL-glutamate epimerase-like enolase superfamily enzyme
MCDDIEGSGTRGSLTLLSEHLLKGMHVFEPEASWAKLTRAANWVGPGGFVNCVIAPLDIAMWDAAAKAVNQRLYGSLAGLATGHRLMPATISGTACHWMNWQHRR